MWNSWFSSYQSTIFLPEIKSDPCVLAIDGKVHVKQVESHHCLTLVQGVIHNVDVPIELQLINDLPTWVQRAQAVTYNVELLIEQQSVNYLPTWDQIGPMCIGRRW